MQKGAVIVAAFVLACGSVSLVGGTTFLVRCTFDSGTGGECEVPAAPGVSGWWLPAPPVITSLTPDGSAADTAWVIISAGSRPQAPETDVSNAGEGSFMYVESKTGGRRSEVGANIEDLYGSTSPPSNSLCVSFYHFTNMAHSDASLTFQILAADGDLVLSVSLSGNQEANSLWNANSYSAINGSEIRFIFEVDANSSGETVSSAAVDEVQVLSGACPFDGDDEAGRASGNLETTSMLSCQESGCEEPGRCAETVAECLAPPCVSEVTYVCKYPEVVQVHENEYTVSYPAMCDDSTAVPCKIRAVIYDLGDLLDVELTASNVPSPGYVALAFSHDTAMGDDSVVACLGNAASSVEVSYNGAYYSNQLLENDKAGIGREAVFELNGAIVCNFTREKRIRNSAHTANIFDLDQPYYLLLSLGSLDTNGLKQKHDIKFATSNMLTLPTPAATDDGDDECPLAEECAVCQHGHTYTNITDSNGCPGCRCLTACDVLECLDDEKCVSSLEKCELGVAQGTAEHPGACESVARCEVFCPRHCAHNVTLPADGAAVEVHTPGYPRPYPVDCMCSWHVRAPHAHAVSLLFTDFQVEGEPGMCQYDRVVVQSGDTTHGVYCGGELPAPLDSTPDNNLDIILISDYSDTRRGLSAQVRAVPVLPDDNMFLLPHVNDGDPQPTFETKTGSNVQLKKILWLANKVPPLLEVIMLNLISDTSRVGEFVSLVATSPELAIPDLCGVTDVSQYFDVPADLAELLDVTEFHRVLCSLDLYQLYIDMHDFKVSDLMMEYLPQVTMDSTMVDVLSSVLALAQDHNTWFDSHSDFSLLFPYRWHNVSSLVSAILQAPHRDYYINMILSHLRPAIEISDEQKVMTYVLNNILTEVNDRLKFINAGDYYLSDAIPDDLPTFKRIMDEVVPLAPNMFDIFLHSMNLPKFQRLFNMSVDQVVKTLCTANLSDYMVSSVDFEPSYFPDIQFALCSIDYGLLYPEILGILGLEQPSEDSEAEAEAEAEEDGSDEGSYTVPEDFYYPELLEDLAANIDAVIVQSFLHQNTSSELILETWFDSSAWDSILSVWLRQYVTPESVFYYVSDTMNILSYVGYQPGDTQSLYDIVTERLRPLVATTMNITSLLPSQYVYLNQRIMGAVDLYPNFVENLLFAMLESPLEFLDQFSLGSVGEFCSAERNDPLGRFNFYDRHMAYWVLHYICTFNYRQAVVEVSELGDHLSAEKMNYTETHLTTSNGDLIVDWRYYLSSWIRFVDAIIQFIDNPPVFTDIRDTERLLQENVRRVLATVDFDRILELLLDLSDILRGWIPTDIDTESTDSSVILVDTQLIFNLSSVVESFSPVATFKEYISNMSTFAEDVWTSSRHFYASQSTVEDGQNKTITDHPDNPDNNLNDTGLDTSTVSSGLNTSTGPDSGSVDGASSDESTTASPSADTTPTMTQSPEGAPTNAVTAVPSGESTSTVIPIEERREELTNVIAGQQRGNESVYLVDNSSSNLLQLHSALLLLALAAFVVNFTNARY